MMIMSIRVLLTLLLNYIFIFIYFLHVYNDILYKCFIKFDTSHYIDTCSSLFMWLSVHAIYRSPMNLQIFIANVIIHIHIWIYLLYVIYYTYFCVLIFYNYLSLNEIKITSDLKNHTKNLSSMVHTTDTEHVKIRVFSFKMFHIA